ncbi:MAG: hypothetical protein HOJ57_40635 [Lentisphaerae bacterium]|nr:hypothetical protein [Lentisphaerota bacterium]MBT5612315.1 hypothetical protein [Lentisphaerota bacterium]MBT7059206.1 hypothetical protein [Lentisphaerota bacterium]
MAMSRRATPRLPEMLSGALCLLCLVTLSSLPAEARPSLPFLRHFVPGTDRSATKDRTFERRLEDLRKEFWRLTKRQERAAERLVTDPQDSRARWDYEKARSKLAAQTGLIERTKEMMAQPSAQVDLPSVATASASRPAAPVGGVAPSSRLPHTPRRSWLPRWFPSGRVRSAAPGTGARVAELSASLERMSKELQRAQDTFGTFVAEAQENIAALNESLEAARVELAAGRGVSPAGEGVAPEAATSVSPAVILGAGEDVPEETEMERLRARMAVLREKATAARARANQLARSAARYESNSAE